MFSALAERNYRYYAGGQILSLTGVWMQRVAQDWLVLDLSDASPTALGFAAALQFLPTLVLSLWAGVLADRMDKRTLLLVLESALGLCALVLGVLTVSAVVTLWHVYVLCLALGAVAAVETPIRQSFVVEMVGREQLTNAVALNSMTFNLARMVGPALAGVMISAVGTGWVFLANAITFVAVLLGLFVMDPQRLHRSAPLPRDKGQLREGVRYVRQRADLRLLMVLVFFVATFSLNFPVSIAILARNVFHSSASAFGLLSTLLAVGTLAGATLAARRTQPRMGVLLFAVLVFGILEAVSGVLPSLWLVGVFLIPTGAAMLTFTTISNATVQLAVSAQMRGRVMGLYMVVFLGGNPIGAPVMGWLAEHFGGRAPMIAGGLVAIVCALAGAAVFARRGEVAEPPG